MDYRLKDDGFLGNHLETGEEFPQCPQWKSSDPFLAATMRRLLATERQLVGKLGLHTKKPTAYIANTFGKFNSLC